MKDCIEIAKALSDSNRVRTLFALRGGELCVCRIIELLSLAPSTVSKHMSVLKHAGLVDSRKEERWIYYRLPDDTSANRKIKGALDWLFSEAAGDEDILNDAARLAHIIGQSPEVLCKKRLAEFQNRKNKQPSTFRFLTLSHLAPGCIFSPSED